MDTELKKECEAVPAMRPSAVQNFLDRHPDGKLAMCAPEVKASNDKQREILHLISTDSVDRAGDIVVPSGAQIDNFMANPVVLQDHVYSVDRIIGKATRLEIESDKIWARTRFEDSERGRQSYRLAKAGLGGWSIGFAPDEYEAIKDKKTGGTTGFKFKTWELLEYSHVAIPMNQDVVNQAIARGLVDGAFARSFFQIEDEDTEPKPADTAAGDGPNVEEPKRLVVPEQVGRAIERQRRVLRNRDLAREIREIAERMNH